MRPPRASAALAMLVASLLSLLVFCHANTFSRDFHPDEGGKVRQVLRGEYNFNHPQLLLRGMEGLNWLLTGDPRNDMPGASSDQAYDAVVVRGRVFSAITAAAAVGLTGWLAYRQRGPAAAAATVGLLVTLPNLVVAGHYAKEDAALAGATALWLVAAAAYLRRPQWGRLILLGLAGGLATSAKSVGAVSAAIGLLLPVLLPPGDEAWRDHPSTPRRAATHGLRAANGVLVAALLAAGAFALVNLPVFAADQAGRIDDAVELAKLQVTDGHSDFLRYDSPALIARVLLRWPNNALLPLALVEVLATLLIASRRRRWELWLLPALCLAHALALAQSSVFLPRYMLLIELSLAALAARGAVTLGELAATWLRQGGRAKLAVPVAAAVAAGACAVPLAGQAVDAAEVLRQFDDDSRRELRRWAKIDLAGRDGVKIAYDNYSRFGHAQQYGVEAGKIRLATDDAGAVERLLAAGYTHVVLNDLDYGRYLDPAVGARPAKSDAVASSRRRLADLLDGGHAVVWRYDNPLPWPRYSNASPSIRVLRLRDPDTDSNEARRNEARP